MDTSADDISVEHCTLDRSGTFMRDYGCLWQITVWPEEHDARERALANTTHLQKCHDVVFSGNHISGSWINQPRNFVLAGDVGAEVPDDSLPPRRQPVT